MEELIGKFKVAKIPLSKYEVIGYAPNYYLFDTDNQIWRGQVEEWFEKLKLSFDLEEKADAYKLIKEITKNGIIQHSKALHNNDELKYVRTIEICPFYRLSDNELFPVIIIVLKNSVEEKGHTEYLLYYIEEDIDNSNKDNLYYKIVPNFGIGYDENNIEFLLLSIKQYILKCVEKIIY